MSVGILLRQARESAGMSIEELSETTCIRRTIIKDLENDDFQSSGGLAYAAVIFEALQKYCMQIATSWLMNLMR